MTERVTRHLLIHGRVQGVGYRELMREQAETLAVTGWVANRRDGSVEAVVQGVPSNVERIIEWCKHGPPWATVTRVDVADHPPDITFNRFERKATQ